MRRGFRYNSRAAFSGCWDFAFQNQASLFASLSNGSKNFYSRATVVHLDTSTNPIRPAAGTDREDVPARSASQRMGMEELSWMSVCHRGRPRSSFLNFFVRWVCRIRSAICYRLFRGARRGRLEACLQTAE